MQSVSTGQVATRIHARVKVHLLIARNSRATSGTKVYVSPVVSVRDWPVVIVHRPDGGQVHTVGE